MAIGAGISFGGLGPDILMKMLQNPGPFLPGGGGSPQVGFLTKFFTNPLVIQMLSAAGRDMLGGGGQNTGAAIDKSIGNVSMVNFIKGLLTGQGVPAGSSVTHDDKGTTIKLPKEIASSGIFDLGGGNSRVLNPFATGQPNLNLSMSDLAGLSPELILEGMKQKFAAEELQLGRAQLEEKSFTDVMDAVFKTSMMPYYEEQADYFKAMTQRETPTINVPGIGMMNASQFNDLLTTLSRDERTTFMKEYDRALNDESFAKSWASQNLPSQVRTYLVSKQLGLTTAKNIDEFRKSAQGSDLTARMKEYEKIVSEGGGPKGYKANEFGRFYEDSLASRAMSPAAVAARTEAIDVQKVRDFLHSPEFPKSMAVIIRKSIEDNRPIYSAMDPTTPEGREKRARFRRDIAINSIKGWIWSMEGRIDKFTQSGDTLSWEVTWPDGKKDTLVYETLSEGPGGSAARNQNQHK